MDSSFARFFSYRKFIHVSTVIPLLFQVNECLLDLSYLVLMSVCRHMNLFCYFDTESYCDVNTVI